MSDDAASDGAPSAPGTKIKRCPICAKQAVEAFKPFCSKRCADIDLGKWFSSAYAIPGRPGDDDADSTPAADEDAPERD